MEKKITVGNQTFNIDILELKAGEVRFKLKDKEYHFKRLASSTHELKLKNEKTQELLRISQGRMKLDGAQWLQVVSNSSETLIKEAPLYDDGNDALGGGKIKAPMPGKIFKVYVKEGEKVEKGNPLVILEAMKMEHTLKALSDGVVEKILFKEGDLVDGGVEILKVKGDQ